MHNSVILTRHKGYMLGSSLPVSDSTRDDIIDSVNRARGQGKGSGLSGRGIILRTEISGWGKSVVKTYRRGGLLGKCIGTLYLRGGTIRAQGEFDVLRKARELGVLAPEPLGYVYQGRLFYRAWLITREIEDAVSLAALSQTDKKRAFELAHQVVKPILTLIRNGIFHIDLHPGNVLVAPDSSLYLIDFDKARIFAGSSVELRDRYLRRWRRAVIKHKLPETLSEIICLELRSAEL